MKSVLHYRSLIISGDWWGAWEGNSVKAAGQTGDWAQGECCEWLRKGGKKVGLHVTLNAIFNGGMVWRGPRMWG